MTNNEALRNEYKARINRVLDYIDNNIGEDLDLGCLAAVANFSPYHFHRIFSAMLGEPLNRYINRLRLERSAQKLIDMPSRPVGDIAYECGFSGPATFARAFKDYYGMSAGEWRSGGCVEFSKNRKMIGKDGKEGGKDGKLDGESIWYICSEFNNMLNKFTWSIEMINQNLKANVEVKDLPEMTLAYVRHIGPYAGDEKLFQSLFNKLFMWAGPRGLIRFPETEMITIYHDNPEITDPEKLRTSVCMTVPPDTETSGDIGKMTIPAGKYAIGRFEIDSSQYGDAWNAMYGGWLPESGYLPDDRPCYENMRNDPKQHPQGKHIVDICVPVKAL